MYKFIIVLTSFLLISCANTQDSSFRPQAIETKGTYVHSVTSTEYPEILAGFKLVSVTQYNKTGTDIGVAYNYFSDTTPVALTVYSYPAPDFISIGSPDDVVEGMRFQLFMNRFNGTKNYILKNKSNAELTSEGPFDLSQDNLQPPGMVAEFKYSERFAGEFMDLRSSLYLFQVGESLYKYRITYPETVNVDSQISEFMNQLELK
ncbi:hypothetical protein M0C34_13890 [Agarivorans sp. TSD2052]|uniref:hypothetical protein n=1 Tax=Agarivorans sp. TSD2052 TaxID=2937286 RepID=UPI0020102AF2|nr:hypothetical protein [Agarivorans sp. TSD2052]UPW17329.1 hypothetical protein M0C34_13890 [Agarivorans sp. TSD2052]